MPLVPVTPIIVSSRAGWPYQFAPITASARREDATTAWGRPPSISCSQTAQTAPFSCAMGIYLCPSDSIPETATKRSPGFVVRES